MITTSSPTARISAAMVGAAGQMKTPASRLRAGFADEKIGIVLTCERDFEREAATS
jgi:hypothetical protein